MSMPSLLDHFDAASRAMSARPAIRHGGRSRSYAELRIASDRVAARLRGLGAGPGAVVGIALDRSIEWVVSMLGILKCGAAYLPLDPAYPQERLALCIADSGARFVISDSSNRGISPDNALLIDELAAPGTMADGADGRHHPPVASTDDGQPAYLLYTSGSTGRPKGVVVSRDALAYQLNWFIREFACTADDVFLQKTPTAFDASVWEYLAPLMVGATMVIGDNTPDAIAAEVRRHGATLLQVVPAMLQVLAEPATLGELASLRMLFSGGEILPRQLVSRVHAHLPIPVVNLYGPTEATVQCAFHVCRPGDGDTRDPVPLGRPLPDTTFRIEHDDGADGPGELVIEGPGVAIGYHGQAEQTAARFGMSETGLRTYRSGDRVTRDRYGDYVFLGRADSQVKLRGQRVELEEIEHALMRALPALRGAAAIVNDVQQIEAFMDIPVNGWDEAAARAALATALPGYMQPAFYTVLDGFPTLPNGKRDRAALRMLGTGLAAGRAVPRTQADAAGDAAGSPQGGQAATDVAARVRAAWARLLPQDAGDDSHFFRAGGHSLLAMQLIAALNRDFDLKLSASALFAQPTLAALTQMVEAAARDADARRLPPGFVKLGGRTGAPKVWFIHPAGGGIWCYRDIAESAQGMESYGIACEPLANGGAYETDLRRMARRYAEQVLAQQEDGPLVLCGYSFGGNVAYEMAVHLQSQGIEVSLLVLLDTYISKPTGEDTLDFIASYARKLVNGGAQAPCRSTLGAMPVGERNRLLLDLGIRGGHLPPDAAPRDVEQGLAMWIANNQASVTHVPGAAFEGPALFVRCTGNARDSLEGWLPLLKWLQVQDVAADHFTLYRPPIAASIGAMIEAAIHRTARGKIHAVA